MHGPSDNAKLATKPSRPVSTSIGAHAPSAAWKPYGGQQHASGDARRAEHQQRPAADAVDEQQREHREHHVHQPTNTVCTKELALAPAPARSKITVA